jgi:hypothetical protein
MDKYLNIIKGPKDNLALKETQTTRSQNEKLFYSFDQKRRQIYNIKPIYSLNYTKKSYNKQKP